MAVESVENAVNMVDEAFNRGDLEAVLDCYEASAVLVREPGSLARGHAELRAFFAGAMRAGASARQLTTSIIEADGVALFMSRWTLNPPADEHAAHGREFIATTVFRKQADGTWKALIDNPIGPLILVRSDRSEGSWKPSLKPHQEHEVLQNERTMSPSGSSHDLRRMEK